MRVNLPSTVYLQPSLPAPLEALRSPMLPLGQTATSCSAVGTLAPSFADGIAAVTAVHDWLLISL